MKLKITKVWIEKRQDESPDTSWMGEYSNKADNRFSIDRETHGDYQRGQFRYFNPSSNYCSKDGTPCDGLSDTNIASYVLQDYKRMQALCNNEWCFIGIIAKAEICNPRSIATHRISSSGLWGIESDSDKAHIAEVEQEELASLRSELIAFGFGNRAIAHAFKNRSVKE